MHGYATFNMLVAGPQNCFVTRCVLPCPRMSIVRGNSVRATSVKRRNKIVQEITRKVANIFSFYAIIAIEHVLFFCFFQCIINIRQVPWEVLKTAAFGLGFQQLPRDLANVNAWKTMFDPYIQTCALWREAQNTAFSSIPLPAILDITGGLAKKTKKKKKKKKKRKKRGKK